MSSWRPALRIARRTVLRSPSRSLLIALLVALPVAGATYVDVIARSFNSAQRDAQRTIGSADAAVTVTGPAAPAGADGVALAGAGRNRRRPSAAASRPSARSPRCCRPAPGSRAMPRQRVVALSRGERIVRANMLIGDVSEPLQRFRMRLEGRRPRPGRRTRCSSRATLAERLRLLDGDRARATAPC